MIIRTRLKFTELLSQVYVTYLTRPVQDTIYAVASVALIITCCLVMDMPLWIPILVAVVLFGLLGGYIWTVYCLYRVSDGTIPIAFDINDKSLTMTYGNEYSAFLSGVSINRGARIWRRDRMLFVIRKRHAMGMLLPEDSSEEVIRALRKHQWITGRPKPSITSTVALVLFILFVCAVVGFALYVQGIVGDNIRPPEWL